MDNSTSRRLKDPDRPKVRGWPWQNREFLSKEYVDQGKDPKEIAAEWECHPDTVRKWIRRYGLREIVDE